MHLYPETGTPVRECWQAEKWTQESTTEYDTPMWADWENPITSWRHYFVHELAQMKGGGYILILKWLLVNGTMSVKAKTVIWNNDIRDLLGFVLIN